MKQAQQIQKNIKHIQKQLATIEIENQSSTSIIKVVITYRHNVKHVTINANLLKNDKNILKDLITAAFNDAMRRAEATAQEKMGDMTADLNLPPDLKLPF